MNIWCSALEWKVTVFCTIYFQALSYPVFAFVFGQNNHGCLCMIQSLQYKTLCKAVLQYRESKKQTKKEIIAL